MSPCVCFGRSGAGGPVEGRAGQQRALVRHAGGQPAPGPPDVRVHSRLRGQVGLHSDFSGGNRAGRTAGPDPASYSEQDATGGDAECHAGRAAETMSFFFNFVWMMQVKRRWPHSSVSSPLSRSLSSWFLPTWFTLSWILCWSSCAASLGPQVNLPWSLS